MTDNASITPIDECQQDETAVQKNTLIRIWDETLSQSNYIMDLNNQLLNLETFFRNKHQEGQDSRFKNVDAEKDANGKYVVTVYTR